MQGFMRHGPAICKVELAAAVAPGPLLTSPKGKGRRTEIRRRPKFRDQKRSDVVSALAMFGDVETFLFFLGRNPQPEQDADDREDDQASDAGPDKRDEHALD